jgi:hypothetical protein
MTVKDRLWVSLRHIRGRMVESTLVIVATTVGVALVAAMVAFIQAYDHQTEYLLSHPAYRELLVEVIGNETELTEPATPYDPTTTREIRLGAENLDEVLQDAPLVAYGYLADAEMLSTTIPGAGFARGFAGRYAGGDMTINQASTVNAGRDSAAGSSDSAGGADASGGAVASGDAQVADTPSGDTAEGEMVFSFRGADGTEVTAELPPGGFQAPEGFQPPEGFVPPEGGPAGRGAGRDGADDSQRNFDLEQFFQTDPDVVTELPVDSFPGRSITADFFDAYGLTATDGSLFTSEDVEQGNKVIVLGSELARTLFPDGDAIGTRVRLNLQTWTVIGILAPTTLTDVDTNTPFGRVAFVPNGEAQFSFGGARVRFQRLTRTLRFAVANSANLDAAAMQLQAHFDAEFGEGTVRITAPIDALRSEREKLGRILGVVLFLAAAGLFIASINVFNLMLMRVIKRTKSVGITRAIGATRRGITRQFFSESALMTVIATGIGLAVSPIVYRMLGSALVQETATAGMNWPYLVVGAIAAMAFSLLFGVYPARQAGRIDAAVAIRTE